MSPYEIMENQWRRTMAIVNSNRFGEWPLQQLFVHTSWGKLWVLKLTKRTWQWMESEIIKPDQSVLAMSLEYLRFVWEKRVLRQYCLWLTCLVKSAIWMFCMTGMLKDSQSRSAIFLQYALAWLYVLQKGNISSTFERRTEQDFEERLST